MKIVPIPEIPKKEDVVDVPTDDLVAVYKVCLEMEQVCSRNFGIGLSAVQVGIPWKLFILDFGLEAGKDPFTKQRFGYYVNCEYEPVGELKEQSLEGCLSIKKPNGQLRHFTVQRHAKVRVKGLELLPSPELRLVHFWTEPTSHYRIVLQHEIDHQHGILISDIGKELDIRNK
jgi:peptide deformylase